MARPDPYRAFRFVGSRSMAPSGAVSDRSPASNGRPRSSRTGRVASTTSSTSSSCKTTYPPLMLKRGLVDTTLWDWHQDVIEGTVERKTITVLLLDEAGQRGVALGLRGAPSPPSGPAPSSTPCPPPSPPKRSSSSTAGLPGSEGAMMRALPWGHLPAPARPMGGRRAAGLRRTRRRRRLRRRAAQPCATARCTSCSVSRRRPRRHHAPAPATAHIELSVHFAIRLTGPSGSGRSCDRPRWRRCRRWRRRRLGRHETAPARAARAPPARAALRWVVRPVDPSAAQPRQPWPRRVGSRTRLPGMARAHRPWRSG